MTQNESKQEAISMVLNAQSYAFGSKLFSLWCINCSYNNTARSISFLFVTLMGTGDAARVWILKWRGMYPSAWGPTTRWTNKWMPSVINLGKTSESESSDDNMWIYVFTCLFFMNIIKKKIYQEKFEISIKTTKHVINKMNEKTQIVIKKVYCCL